MSHNNFGMNARHSHKEPGEEMKEIFKQNGSLSDYQKKPNKKSQTDADVGEMCLRM